jgi:hypothetical protein
MDFDALVGALAEALEAKAEPKPEPKAPEAKATTPRKRQAKAKANTEPKAKAPKPKPKATVDDTVMTAIAALNAALGACIDAGIIQRAGTSKAGNKLYGVAGHSRNHVVRQATIGGVEIRNGWLPLSEHRAISVILTDNG